MRTKNETAQLLADAHFRLDQGITRIFRLLELNESEDARPVKLLEVSSVTPEVGISPVGMAADPARGIFHASTVVEITPDEFDRLMRGELRLPQDWRLGEELFARASATRAAS